MQDKGKMGQMSLYELTAYSYSRLCIIGGGKKREPRNSFTLVRQTDSVKDARAILWIVDSIFKK